MTREIVASTIVLPMVDMLSDPDFWNQQLDEKVARNLVLKSLMRLIFYHRSQLSCKNVRW